MCWVLCVSYFTAKGYKENCIRNKTPTYHVLSVAVLAIPKTWQPPEAFRCSFLFTLRDFALIREEKRRATTQVSASLLQWERFPVWSWKKGNRIPPQ